MLRNYVMQWSSLINVTWRHSFRLGSGSEQLESIDLLVCSCVSSLADSNLCCLPPFFVSSKQNMQKLHTDRPGPGPRLQKASESFAQRSQHREMCWKALLLRFKHTTGWNLKGFFWVFFRSRGQCMQQKYIRYIYIYTHIYIYIFTFNRAGKKRMSQLFSQFYKRLPEDRILDECANIKKLDFVDSIYYFGRFQQWNIGHIGFYRELCPSLPSFLPQNGLLERKRSTQWPRTEGLKTQTLKEIQKVQRIFNKPWKSLEGKDNFRPQ